MRLTEPWAAHNVLERENMWLENTDKTGNWGRKDVNERTEKQIFENNRRM